MRILKFLLKKEFRQIFRNKAILPMIFVAPVIQLLILPLAADYEIKNIRISIVDHDHSSYSQKLITTIVSSGYFILNDFGESFDNSFMEIESNRSDLVLEIPIDFESNMIREKHEKLFIAINAINGVKAGLGGVYLTSIIRNFNNEIRMDWMTPDRFNRAPVVTLTSSNWFNKELSYQFFMVPGILAILVTMIGAYMCALNIVKEKEVGTIEQINVTPIKKHYFILGKLIPFWFIGQFMFSFGLFIIGYFAYGIVPLGSIWLLYLFLSVYLIAVLGFGLLLSTYANTQQQAMSLAFFFIIIFILMSGLFTPIESMPTWAGMIAKANPVTYFIEVMRMVILKGSTFQDIIPHFLITILFAVIFNGWAIINYKKTS